MKKGRSTKFFSEIYLNNYTTYNKLKKAQLTSLIRISTKAFSDHEPDSYFHQRISFINSKRNIDNLLGTMMPHFAALEENFKLNLKKKPIIPFDDFNATY